MFKFSVFHSAHSLSLQITHTSDFPKTAQIILWNDYGHISRFEFNAPALRKHFESKYSATFRDWRITNFTLPSSELSLERVDISNCRVVNYLNVFKYFNSKGNPSESDNYMGDLQIYSFPLHLLHPPYSGRQVEGVESKQTWKHFGLSL